MTHWQQQLNAAGEGMLGWTLSMNLWCGAILVCAMLLDRVLRGRVSPGWRMALYAAVLVRLALPLSFASPVAIGPAREATYAVRYAQRSPVQIADGAATVAGEATGAAMTYSWHAMVPGVYVLGLVTLVRAWVASSRRLGTIVRDSRRDEALSERFPVPVCRHPRVGPVLIGVLRPRLILPEGLETAAGGAGMRWVLEHEAAHLKRRDPLLATVLLLACIITWPVAAVWLAVARMRDLMEQACDERALRDRPPADRESYAVALISLATRRRQLATALPFGQGIRSRIRALRNERRWPWAVQAGLCLCICIALLACSGSRTQSESATLSTEQPRITNAEAEPFKGSLPIQVTVLKSWPGAPSIQGLGQRPQDATTVGAACRVLSPEEFGSLLSRSIKDTPAAVLSRPRIEVIPGMQASISVGEDGPRADGFTLGSLVKRVETRAGENRKTYLMDLQFERHDAGKASRSSVQSVSVAQGQTVIFRSSDSGASPLLVCVTPGHPPTATRFDGPRPDPTAGTTLLTFEVQVHRVDAPREPGAFKADGAMHRWSAVPGGAAMSARKFEVYQSDLRRRPGYTRLAAPRVSVYAGQEATIELNPEPESPDAKHVIRVSGTPADSGVLCIGSYARQTDGGRVEGSWTSPLTIEPGGAVVWSIHDPHLGAWYTTTIKATTSKPGDIKPQTATLRPQD